MSDLERALRAMRDAHDGRSDDAARTRARVLLRASEQHKRRRVAALFIAPLAAALVVSMAWAASTGRIAGWLEWIASRGDRSPPVATMQGPLGTMQAPPSPAPLAPTTSGSVAPVDVDASDADASDARDLDAGAALLPTAFSPPRATASGAPSARPSPSTPASAARDAGPSEEESLYQRAHQAHFVARDAAAALRTWDDYLRAYPNGRFALEARYNRALGLVRLGRYAEARAALAPFAAGQYGGYRQSEARALLDAMDAGAP